VRQLLIAAFKDTVARIEADADRMRLADWNESVFRFMYSLAVARREQNIRQFSECGSIDLVLRHKNELGFVEFKFYVHRPKYDPFSGEKCQGMKSYPSRKNYREFEKSVGTIRGRLSANHDPLKFVALFYSDPDPMSDERKTYYWYYGDDSRLESQVKIHRIDSTQSFSRKDDGSKSICYAKLYEILN